MQKDYAQGMKKLFKIVKPFAGKVLDLTGSTYEVEGLENIPTTGPVLYVGNHQSNFDIPAILATSPRPVGFIAKQEVAKVGLLKPWVLGIGSQLLPRGETRKALEVVINTIKFLRKTEHGLVLFPEGTRSSTGEVQEFKPGGLKIATKSGATLVPVAISGTAGVMPKGSKVFYPQHIRVKYLKPYSGEELKNKDTIELANELKKTIEEEIASMK